MSQEQSTPKRAPKEGEVAAIAEQVLDIFLGRTSRPLPQALVRFWVWMTQITICCGI